MIIIVTKEVINLIEKIISREMENYLLKNDEKVLVLFVKDNSAPGNTMIKILNQFADINKEEKVFIVNSDKEMIAKYGIESVPTCILFEKGQPVKKRFGTLSIKEIGELVNEKSR